MSEIRRPESFEGSRTAGENQSILNEVWKNTANDCLSKALMPDTKNSMPPDLSGMHYIDCTPILGYDCAAISREAAGLIRPITIGGPDSTTGRPLLTLARSESTTGRPGGSAARPDYAPVRPAETTPVRPGEVAPRPATPAARPAETPTVRTAEAPPRPAVKPEAPAVRPEVPAVRPEIMAPRPTDRTPSDAPIRTTTPRGDTGFRYRTPDARGSGANEVETDHMGIVRSLSTTDAAGRRIAISGERLAGLLAGKPAGMGDSPSPHDWRVSRTGTGDNTATTVTAPDGRTTYTLDTHGRLTGEVGSHRITPPGGVIPVDLRPGTRYDSTGAAGELRSARTSRDGVLEGVSIRSLAGGIQELTPDKWSGLKPEETRDLGDGWTATRSHFHGVHHDGTRISHTDGTTYIVNPTGRLLYASNPIESAAAERMSPERATAVRRGTYTDEGTRYSTPDRRGTGTNHLDVDKLGIVRGFAHTAPGDATRTLSMELIDKIPADGLPRPLRNGWTASRSGTGESSVTTVVAPDGATTYRIDSTGALISKRSSVEIPKYSAVVTTNTDRGSSRTDSIMSDGRIASGHTTSDGTLTHISLKDKTGATTTITREQWDHTFNDHIANGDLGSGWRIRPTYSAHFPAGTRVLEHTDGTAYFIGPKGNLTSALSSMDSARERRF